MARMYADRHSGTIPDLSNELTKRLFTTYLSYAPQEQLAYGVEVREDDRGWLFEFLRSESAGQLFVSSTKPGVVRGNHFHDSKVERFCVISGAGRIVIQDLSNSQQHVFEVSDREIRVVEIPPGTVHSIANTGDSEMITLFWANEPFDPQSPDTWSTSPSGNPC